MRFMQLMWGAGCAGVAFALFSILAAVTLPFYLATGGFIGAAIFALAASAGLCAMAYMLFTGRIARMVTADRRLVPFITLGIAGLITMSNMVFAWGPAWYVLLALLLLLAKIGAIITGFILLLQPEVVAWLNAQQGPPTAPPSGYGGPPPPPPYGGTQPPPPAHGGPPPPPPAGPPPAN